MRIPFPVERIVPPDDGMRQRNQQQSCQRRTCGSIAPSTPSGRAVSLELALAKDAYAAGTTVNAHLYAGREHNGTVNASLADSIPFVKRVLAGETIVPVCSPKRL